MALSQRPQYPPGAPNTIEVAPHASIQGARVYRWNDGDGIALGILEVDGVGRVLNVWVEPKFQRKGIGQALQKRAQQDRLGGVVSPLPAPAKPEPRREPERGQTQPTVPAGRRGFLGIRRGAPAPRPGPLPLPVTPEAVEASCRALADAQAALERGEAVPALAAQAQGALEVVSRGPVPPAAAGPLQRLKATLERLASVARDRGGACVEPVALAGLCRLALALARRDLAGAEPDGHPAMLQRGLELASCLAHLAAARSGIDPETLFVVLAASGRLHEAWHLAKATASYEPRWLLNPGIATAAERAAAAGPPDDELREFYTELCEAWQSAGADCAKSKTYAVLCHTHHQQKAPPALPQRP
ncbi:MAG: GNAT family N-acetyltransferase [Planctomycetes bacterium]|nr:GNAT family N-acetyltransferase [Planctomycetota bacterium]